MIEKLKYKGDLYTVLIEMEKQMNDKGQVEDGFKLIFWGILGIILIIFFFSSIYTIDAGERGIVLTFGKPSASISQPGIHFKIPMVQSVVKMSVRTQTVQFDNKQGQGDNSEYSSLFAASSDLQDVQIGSVVNYHINEADVLDIYRKYGDEATYQKNILEPIIRETVKSTSAQYTAEELVTKRSEFSGKVAQMLSDKFVDKSGVFEKYDVVNFQFSPTFTAAIEAKVTAEQNALAAKNKLEQIKYEAQQRIEQAQGEAEAIKIQSAAITAQGGKDYVQLQAIQKWNGVLPTYTGGGAVPFVNIGSVQAN